jgi:hypothetical protein
MGQYVSTALGITPTAPVPRPPLASARQNSGLLSYFRSPPVEPHVVARPPSEVLEAHNVLLNFLPPELCSAVLEHAEYWTMSSSIRKQRIRLSSGTTFMQVERADEWPPFPTEVDEYRSWARFDSGEFPYLVSLPVGAALDSRGQVVQGEGGYLRGIEVFMKSRDQGWSDAQGQFYGMFSLSATKDSPSGTYNGSYSWFELCLIRDGAEVEGSRCDIQRNVHGEFTLSREAHRKPVNT